MNLRSTLALIATLIALSSNSAFAQGAGDMEGVKAASNAFYSALAVIDDGTAMEKVWVHTAYGHIGWPAQQIAPCRLEWPKRILGR